MAQKQQKRWLVDAVLFLGLIVCFFVDSTGEPAPSGSALPLALWRSTTWLHIGTGSRAQPRSCSNEPRQPILFPGRNHTDRFYPHDLHGCADLKRAVARAAQLSKLVFLHLGASITTLLAVALKIGFHAGWIVMVARRMFGKATNPSPMPALQAAPYNRDRREFLKLFGVVAAVSLLALGQTIPGLAGQSGTDETAAQSDQPAGLPSRPGQFAAGVSGSGCAACWHSCSYPGRCPLYVDSDNNGRCDLGECQS